MTDKILDKLLNRDHPGRGHEHAESDSQGIGDMGADSAEDLGCFGYLRGIRDRALMLELRRTDGSVIAIGYGWLERVEFDPNEGITLQLAGRSLRIMGRNLNREAHRHVRLFQGITRHRVPWIQQSSESAAVGADEHRPIVTGFAW